MGLVIRHFLCHLRYFPWAGIADSKSRKAVYWRRVLLRALMTRRLRLAQPVLAVCT